jgi:hypothetical protein
MFFYQHSPVKKSANIFDIVLDAKKVLVHLHPFLRGSSFKSPEKPL